MKQKMKNSLTMPKKLKRGPFGIFQHPFCRKIQKIEGGPLVKKSFSEKSLTEPKILSGSTLWPC